MYRYPQHVRSSFQADGHNDHETYPAQDRSSNNDNCFCRAHASSSVAYWKWNGLRNVDRPGAITTEMISYQYAVKLKATLAVNASRNLCANMNATIGKHMLKETSISPWALAWTLHFWSETHCVGSVDIHIHDSFSFWGVNFSVQLMSRLPDWNDSLTR